MRLKACPAVFTSSLENILGCLTRKKAFAYFLDCNIFSHSAEELIEQHREAFDCFYRANVKFNRFIYEFFRQQSPSLDHAVCQDATQNNPVEILILPQHPIPQRRWE